MGCGCSGRRPSLPRTQALRPASLPARPANTGLTSAASPAEVRALGLQQNTAPKSQHRLDAERRRIEKLKRDAIRAKLNK